MKFVPDEDAVPPAQEWLARVSPFLTADDPHQQCVRRAIDAGLPNVNFVCTCTHEGCTQPCCNPEPEEYWA